MVFGVSFEILKAAAHKLLLSVI
jgi:hypothetical protein